jgi:hypothetical protein
MRALRVAAELRISGSAAGSIAAPKGRPPAREPDPIEWSALDPGEDLAPGSRYIGTVEDACAEPSDEVSGPWGSRPAKTCEERGA